jgi:hypothetical protein
MDFDSGDTVMTPKGKGVVAYKRMAPPTYAVAECYSVKLEDKKDDPNYTGTVFPASEVTEYKEEQLKKASVTPLYGYNSQERSYQVDSYPYGRLRCKIKFWLEKHPKRGFRFCSQTENPKNGQWNNPRQGTYYILAACLFLDDKQHVQCSMLSEYTEAKQALEFLQNFPDADTSNLKLWIAGRKVICKRTIAGEAVFTINKVPQMPTETEIEKAKEELRVLEDCFAVICGFRVIKS